MWNTLYARFKQPVIDAVTVAVSTFVASLTTGHVEWSDALLLAVAAGGAVLIKAINPADTSYGVNATWRERDLPTSVK